MAFCIHFSTIGANNGVYLAALAGPKLDRDVLNPLVQRHLGFKMTDAQPQTYLLLPIKCELQQTQWSRRRLAGPVAETDRATVSSLGCLGQCRGRGKRLWL